MLLETLKDWKYLNNQLARLKSKIQEKECKITATFSDAKVFVSGNSSSKVEDLCFERMEITNEIEAIRKRMNMCRKAYAEANLTEDEKSVIKCICAGNSLLELSKKRKIAQARIYRIRGRAIKKMFVVIQNERKD